MQILAIIALLALVLFWAAKIAPGKNSTGSGGWGKGDEPCNSVSEYLGEIAFLDDLLEKLVQKNNEKFYGRDDE